MHIYTQYIYIYTHIFFYVMANTHQSAQGLCSQTSCHTYCLAMNLRNLSVGHTLPKYGCLHSIIARAHYAYDMNMNRVRVGELNSDNTSYRSQCIPCFTCTCIFYYVDILLAESVGTCAFAATMLSICADVRTMDDERGMAVMLSICPC